ncbi:uncharacterized protein F4812DRAFT_434481 [Daldinia caldariorum]|uniref:uncharacterized protein n=1 Tax=Daldinia caldariorum TaxID=326644 RepID=UPI002008951A|nr:uncharacterized protein F4812DRAFT_434481 [Daldinia caldariorum]KAI1466534.1 hypothetical protein F4812DRAFT_434481 [Daldinia caldariorum]
MCEDKYGFYSFCNILTSLINHFGFNLRNNVFLNSRIFFTVCLIKQVGLFLFYLVIAFLLFFLTI